MCVCGVGGGVGVGRGVYKADADIVQCCKRPVDAQLV